jgi:hypothetical protein
MKNRRDESNLATIHINLEVPQKNFLCSYIKQLKISFFSFFFSQMKSENRSAEQVLPKGRG